MSDVLAYNHGTHSVRTGFDLRRIAKVWATAAGASHRVAGEGEMIHKRIGPELSNELLVRLALSFRFSTFPIKKSPRFSHLPRCRW